MVSRMNKMLVGAFGLLVATLLVGQRLGFAWAGGPGYVPPQVATVKSLEGSATADALGKIRTLKAGDQVRRGEIVETSGGYAELDFKNGSRLGLDAGTDAALEAMTDAEVDVRTTHGRLIAGDVTGRKFVIRTDESESTAFAGTFAVIDEQSRAVVHVVPFHQPVGLIVHKQDGFIAAAPQQVHEIAPYEVTAVGQDATVKAAAPFFARFGVR
jgi:hypothetical protein